MLYTRRIGEGKIAAGENSTKDPDHDYEQIQIQFDLKTGKKKYIVSSVGPVDYAGHGVEIYTGIPKATFQNTEYKPHRKNSSRGVEKLVRRVLHKSDSSL